MEGRPPDRPGSVPPEEEATRVRGGPVPPRGPIEPPRGEATTTYRETDRLPESSLEDELFEVRDETRKLRFSLAGALVLGAVATILAVLALLQANDRSPIPGQSNERVGKLSDRLEQEQDRNSGRAKRLEQTEERVDRLTRANNRLVDRVEEQGGGADADQVTELQDQVKSAQSAAEESDTRADALERRVDQLADRVSNNSP
ncbi:MAG: hypothetical protein ACR2NV_10650 [Thermoleophilaceae bacterium]